MSHARLTYTLDMDPSSLWITATPSPGTRSSFLYVQEAGDFRPEPNMIRAEAG